MRKATVRRKTAETDILLTLNLDGNGASNVATGCGFMDHMLTLFAAHGRFDLEVSCAGDTQVDDHHSVEDIGICLGQAFLEALGDKRGIYRYADRLIPMDEALIQTAVDISGRGALGYGLRIPTQKVGTFDTELVEEFWLAFTREARLALHFVEISGTNAHHIIEGAFKSAARSLGAAAAIDERRAGEIPSTKGVL